VTLSRILALAAVYDGYSVRTGESLGMAQRFGTVVSFVRIGINTAVHAPTFGIGKADYLIGLELTEAARNLKYLKKRGMIILNDEVKPPLSSSLGYEPGIDKATLIHILKENAEIIVIANAKELAREAGNEKALNMVLLGMFNAYSKLLTEESIEKAIMVMLPGNKGRISIKAYRLGGLRIKELIY
jgi:indolepyruvate ferredoxin oxidoreductase beta subunit